MKFTIIAPMYNEEKYISSWINNVLKLDADEVIVGLDRCIDNSEKLLRPYGFKIIKYDNTPNGYKMRAAGIRRDLYNRSSNDVIVNTSADLLLDPKIKEHVKQIGKYGLISFGYWDYPYNIQSFLRSLICQYTPLHGFAGLLSFSKDAWEKTEDIEDLKTIPRAEDTHLHMAIREHYPTNHILTKSWHLRPNEDKFDHYNRGQAKYTLQKQGVLKAFAHSVFMLRPSVLTGYMHAKRGLFR